MRITHNLHFTGYRVEDFTKTAGPGRPFVTIDMDHEDRVSQATLYLYGPAECDELIKAAAKAKRLLTGKPALDDAPAFEGKAALRGEHPYPEAPASRYGYAPDSPLGRYDREAHKAWYQKQHPDGDHWPPMPLTDDEAAKAIADYEGKPSLVGRLVEDAHDDSPAPVVGKVVGQVDEDTVEVAWGVQRSAANPLTHHEPIDALRPARDGSGM